MNLPRKYLMLYVVLGSILIFSLKDTLNLIHTLLHAIPNPLHAHTFAHQHLPIEHHTPHDEHVPHTHQVQQPSTHGHHHDVMDHLAYGNSKERTVQNNKEIKTSSEISWNIEKLFSFQLCQPYQLQGVATLFTSEHIQFRHSCPPSPPPKIS